MYCLWCHQPFFEELSWRSVFQLTEPSLLCPECSQKLEPIHGRTCRKCSRPLDRLEEQFLAGDRCTDCVRWGDRALEKNYSLYVYNDFLQEVIAKWKYRGDAELVKIFSPEIKRVARELVVDALIPIPLSRARLYERSFNQARLLAETLPYPIIEGLRSDEALEKQSKKSRSERLAMKNRFLLGDVDLTGKRVALIDDIYTTGATVHAAADLVKKAGAKSVVSLTIARG